LLEGLFCSHHATI